MVTYQQFFNLCKKQIDLTWVSGQQLAQTPFKLTEHASEYPTLAAGFLNIIHPDRFHVVGQAEINFLNTLTVHDRIELIHKFVEGKSLGIIVAEDLILPSDMLEAIASQPLVLFSSKETPEEVLTVVRNKIVRALAPSCSMHGVFMDVFGLGVLLTGQSGIGKSELGLELVTRGHGLIADDVVDFIQKAPGWIEGRSPELLINLLEVRGIGLLDIKTIFGESSVRRKMRLNLVAELHQFDEGELMERLPETDLYTNILGTPIKKMIIPVGGGRNLAVLVEAAVRSAILQMRGIDTIQEFFNRQRILIEREQENQI